MGPRGSAHPEGTRAARHRGRGAGAFHFVDRRRLYAALCTGVATALLCLAVQGPWWVATELAYDPLTSVQVQSITVDFHLGGYVSCSTYNWHPPYFPCDNVSGTVEGTLGLVYLGANDAVLAMAFAAAIASALLWVGNTGLNLGRPQLRLILLLLLALMLTGAGVLGATTLAGPGAQGAAFCNVYSGDITNCPFFWGSQGVDGAPGECPTCGFLLHWGGGTAYYETLAATGLLGAAYVLVRIGRKGPYSPEEQAAWAAMNRPVTLSGRGPSLPASWESPAASRVSEWTQAPVQSSVYPAEVTREAWRCPRCGRVNSPWAGLCGHCREARPPG